MVAEGFTPNNTESVTRFRASLQELFLTPFIDGQDLTAADLNRIQQLIASIDERSRRPFQVIESETSCLTWHTRAAEGLYHFALGLPWLLVAITVFAWVATQLGLAGPLWERWLKAAAAAAAGWLATALLFALARGRYFPPRWRLMEGPAGRVLVFRRITGQTAKVWAGEEVRVRTSWLGRLLRLSWVEIVGTPPFLAPGILDAHHSGLDRRAASHDTPRSVREGFALAVTAILAGFVLLRTFVPAIRQWLSPDDQVLLLTAATGTAYLVFGRMLSWLVPRSAGQGRSS
jgi:hypothetical protein